MKFRKGITFVSSWRIVVVSVVQLIRVGDSIVAHALVMTEP
jgi:hypothetical protein